jgi:hypothetical protein
MADIFLPGYDLVDLRTGFHAGGRYDETSHPKLCWHTTEGTTVGDAETAFRFTPPHLCVDPVRGIRHQYIPLNRHAFAVRGTESDDEFMIQVEVVGVAKQSHTWPDTVLRWLGEHVVVPIRDTVGVPDVVVHHGFWSAADAAARGIVLAEESSPIRITSAELRAFSGHLGHQHMPPPDEHWDPGGLPIHRILEFSRENDMQLTELIDFRPAIGPDGSGRNLWDAHSQVLHILGIMQAKLDAGFGALQDDEARVVDAVRGIVAAHNAVDLTVTDEQLQRLAALLAAALPPSITADDMQRAVHDAFTAR